jgi:L-threonylcarbamoyladenylate synthase
LVDVVPASSALDRAVAALRDGDVIAIPTDTVYGVAVDPFVAGATNRLFEAKRRPRDVTLPVLVAEPTDVDRVAIVNDLARALMGRHWPGGLTIVLDRRPELTADLGTNERTVGVRCPDDDFARELCRRVGPLATTSANLHGEPTPETAAGIADALGDAVALVVDGGPCSGAPSTVVDCTSGDVVLVREGRIPFDALAD